MILSFLIAFAGAVLLLILAARLWVVDQETKLGKYRAKDAGLADLLNYAAEVDDGVIVCKNGSLMASWLYRGEDTPAFKEAHARGYIGAGFCPGGYGYMIKKILAAKGDHVVISGSGVFVNGKLLPNSKPMDVDSQGRSLHHIDANIDALDEHSVLLMSDYSAKSFDARYFGTIDTSAIISTVRPLWTR